MDLEKLSGSEQKIQEYISRIKNGESKDSIMSGLPPSFIAGIESGLNSPKENEPNEEIKSEIPPQYQGLDAETLNFIWTIPEYVDPERTKQEREKKQRAVDSLRNNKDIQEEVQKNKLIDNLKIETIRKEIGTGSDETIAMKQKEIDLFESQHNNEQSLVVGLIKYVSQGRNQAVIDLYQNFFANINNQESRQQLFKGLFQDIYNKYRLADYGIDPHEEQTWNEALNSRNIEINNKKSEWMYRGIFPKNGEETVTRGSLNVKVTPELISAIDNLIISGKIKANYKFGQPGTSASPSDRHDSISLYFLEQPSNEALEELSQTIKPYVRGDNLLGKKIEDGFFMSEIGSIETEHVESFVNDLKSIDSALAEAIKGYCSPRPGQGNSLKMSEAQYYAIKDVVRAFGYNISYAKDSGFNIAN